MLGDGVQLTMGTGPDHSIYDIYIGGSLWQSFDGYAAAAGQIDIKIEVHGAGPHLLEIRNRPEKNTGSTGFKVRFKQLVILDRTYDLHTIEYTYDALSRLREARYNPNVNTAAADADLLRRYQYAFDVAGNRTQQTVTIGGTPTTTNYTYNAANQLTSGGATYDHNGNMTSNGTNTHTWDRANRLLSMGGAAYQYDGGGHRVRQTVGANVTKYLLDLQPGLSVVLSATKDTDVTRYVHGPRGIHAQENPAGDWSWMAQDGLGSVRSVADNNAAVDEVRLYELYGKPVTGSSYTYTATTYGFTGEPTETVNSLIHLRARDYHPALGVFTALDPFEGISDRPISLNRYLYVEGNAPNKVDPSGMILESPAVGNACYTQRPQTTAFETPAMTAARNATVVVRTVDYVNPDLQKTCDPRQYRDNPFDFFVSGAGLGTLGTSGFWTHDHYEDRSQKRSEGDKSVALSNIHSHDCIQFIGIGNRVISVKGEAVSILNDKTPENTLLLNPKMFDGFQRLRDLTEIAVPIQEGSVAGCGYACSVGLYYARQSIDLGPRGENILNALWEDNVVISLASMDISDKVPTPQDIQIYDRSWLGVLYDTGFNIHGYRFAPILEAGINPFSVIKPGDSGGGIFNRNGILIGVTNAQSADTQFSDIGVFAPIR